MTMMRLPGPPTIPGRLYQLLRADRSLRYKVLATVTAILAGLAYLTGHTPMSMRPMAGASITPITNVSGGASGISFSGDAYDVSCTASAATGTMYPALYDGSAWTIYYSYPCAYDGSVVTKVSCIFPARRAVGGETLTWNAFKTGSATLSSCTAQQRYNGSPFPFPSAPSSASSSSTSGLGIYGTGDDGDVTISGGLTTLSRDMVYNTLVVDGTGTLKTAGFRVYAKTSITVASGGVIHNDGNAASGATPGNAPSTVTIGGGGAGGHGQVAAGTGASGTTTAFGGAGGSGGAGSGGSGGSGGTITAPFASNGTARTLPMAAMGSFAFGTGLGIWRGGAGGGGGGGNGASAGGGGGGGGGVMLLVAKAITNDGTIRCAGGAGAAGTWSNTGGGGGGGGGTITVVTQTGGYTGTAPSVPGGTGGASGGGTGVAGSAGSTGTVMTLYN